MRARIMSYIEKLAEVSVVGPAKNGPFAVTPLPSKPSAAATKLVDVLAEGAENPKKRTFNWRGFAKGLGISGALIGAGVGAAHRQAQAAGRRTRSRVLGGAGLAGAGLLGAALLNKKKERK